MLKSMTGFGRGECIRHDRCFKVEIKSVNHRYVDFMIKMPRFLNPFEDRIRKRLARDITRGKVEVWINFENFAQEDISIRVNIPFADEYMKALHTLSDRYNWGEQLGETGLKLLARHPDVITIDKFEIASGDESMQSKLWEILSDALEQALDSYNTMRITEGNALIQSIQEKREHIGLLLTQIAERTPVVADEQAAKLRERVTEILTTFSAMPSLDESRILTEVAIMADRGCIDEEITRIESHLTQLNKMLLESGAIGRKLDFLAQELHREANTLGAKSTDVVLAQLVVELKSEVEKIREQVQNIE